MTELRGIDFAWTKPSAAAAKAADYLFGIGYLSTDSTKNLTGGVITDFHAHGLGIGAVWETTVHATEGGSAAGVRDAEAAYAQAHALGFPAGTCVYFAVDEDIAVSRIAPYFLAVSCAANNWGYRHGVYGSLAVVEGVLGLGYATLGWQTSAWSNGQVSNRAALYQRQRHTGVPIAGVPSSSYDEDVQLAADAGLWLPGEAAPVPPVPASSTAPVNRRQVIELQDAVRVKPDGFWGPATDAALMVVRGAACLHQVPANCRALQTAVGTPADGVWGPKSQAALATTTRAVQQALGVPVDGDWGPVTDHWFAIVRYCDNGK